jgi:hypothetical protein
MPKWLVLSAIGGIILVVLLMTWLNNRSLEQPADDSTAVENEQVASEPPASAEQQGPVVLSATAPVWLSVYDRGGSKFFEGVLNPGTDFQVPATATAPLLRTGKPEALRVTVGGQAAPSVGPAATTVRDVSLLPADLMKAGRQAVTTIGPATSAPSSAPQQARPGLSPAPQQARPAPAASSPPPAENPPAMVTNDAAGQ